MCVFQAGSVASSLLAWLILPHHSWRFVHHHLLASMIRLLRFFLTKVGKCVQDLSRRFGLAFPVVACFLRLGSWISTVSHGTLSLSLSSLSAPSPLHGKNLMNLSTRLLYYDKQRIPWFECTTHYLHVIKCCTYCTIWFNNIKDSFHVGTLHLHSSLTLTFWSIVSRNF